MQVVINDALVANSDDMTALSEDEQTSDQTHSSCAAMQLICPDQARPQNLNRLVEYSLRQVLPKCRSARMRVLVDLDSTLPQIPLLSEPFQEALCAAFDLCVVPQGPAILVTRTCAENLHAIVEVERRTLKIPGRCQRISARTHSCRSDWREVGAMGQLELLVGQQVLRALGGRLRVMRAHAEFRARFELPLPKLRCSNQMLGRYTARASETNKTGLRLRIESWPH